MKWIKKGLIIAPEPQSEWASVYCMCPTPELIEDGCIRVFYTTSGSDQRGRITFVDLDPTNPSKIVRQAESPALDLGEEGCFDDSGVVPSCTLPWNGNTLLYYSGYQRSVGVPYLLFGGVALSGDGRKFQRHSKVPMLERTTDEVCLRSGPFVLRDGPRLRMWYVSGRGWHRLSDGKMVPDYVIKVTSSDSPFVWREPPQLCISPERSSEIGFGKPWVLQEEGMYRMWYSVREKLSPALITYTAIGYAESQDGISWVRKDSETRIERSDEGWDSEMVCYPAVIRVGGRSFLFYNGNGNGKTGFGYAELEK